MYFLRDLHTTNRDLRGISTHFALIVVAVVIIVSVIAVLVTTSIFANDNPEATTQNSSATDQLNASQIYARDRVSIVTVQGSLIENTPSGPKAAGVLGSGFVVQFSSSDYVITNYHVAGKSSNLTVTFSSGDEYPAELVGSDPYSDLAAVSVRNAPSVLLHPVALGQSSSLVVGAPVLAIGNPFGLSGTITTGIVSQLGRTIQDPTAGNFSIANVIQFSAPINPGNSGGALINTQGLVVGITTASVTGSQGLEFAIPSQTIIKELPSLIANGSYNLHSYLGISEVGMNYQLARAMGVNTTYGVLIESVVPGGPAAAAGLVSGSQSVLINGQQYLTGGDIITSVNSIRIISIDGLSSYLEANTTAGESVNVGIIRGGASMNVNVLLGARPPPSV